MAFVVLILGSSTVEAQAWLADRSRAEGIGIRAGNLEIHPGLGAEVGYDSNVFLRDGTLDYSGDQKPQGSAILRVTPHVFLSTLGAARSESDAQSPSKPAVDFRLGASLPVYYYFSTAQRSRVEANADLSLKLLPERPVSFLVNARFNRTARPFTQAGSGVNYGRNTVDVGPRINFQTSGGVLKIGLGGDFSYTFFDEGTRSFGRYDNKSYAGTLNASWEFLPKTALVYDAKLSYRGYDVNGGASALSPLRNDGTLYQTRIGLNGALSARVSATVLMGYTSAFFDGGDDSDDVTLLAELRWKPSDTVQAALGYDRSLVAAYQGNFSRTDRVFANVGVVASGAFLLSVGGNVSAVSYGQDPIGDERRKDVRVGGDLSGEYRFADWIALTANAGVTTNITDFAFVPEAGIVDPAKFTRFEAFVGMRVFY